MLHTTTIAPHTLELLNTLMQKSYLQRFNLVGGTALALQIGHRISVDLDLFTPETFDSRELQLKLEDDFADFQLIYESENTLITTINTIKVDFIRFRYGFAYPVTIDNNIRMANEKDISSMKLDAITGRGAKKDFFDLYFLLQKYPLNELLDLYQEKYRHSTIFHVIKSITYFEEANMEPSPVVIDNQIDWETVKQALVKEVKAL